MRICVVACTIDMHIHILYMHMCIFISQVKFLRFYVNDSPLKIYYIHVYIHVLYVCDCTCAILYIYTGERGCFTYQSASAGGCPVWWHQRWPVSGCGEAACGPLLHPRQGKGTRVNSRNHHIPVRGRWVSKFARDFILYYLHVYWCAWTYIVMVSPNPRIGCRKIFM